MLLTDAELADKVARADLGEASPPPAAPPPSSSEPQPAPIVDESAPWIDAAMQYGAVLRTALPEGAAAHWTDERLHKFGEALARCARHYGWKWGELFNHPLAILAAAGWPLAWPIAAPYLMPHLARALGRRSPSAAPPAPPFAPPSGAVPASERTAPVQVLKPIDAAP